MKKYLSVLFILLLNVAVSLASSQGPKVYTQRELLKMSGQDFKDGILPLGNSQYVTDGPKKGYVYLCNARSDEQAGGAQRQGPWIDEKSKTWNFLEKIHVSGAVKWSEAKFTNIVNGTKRILSGNNLPKNTTTGNFPVANSDEAFQYDRNPNSIKAQNISLTLPKTPNYLEKPNCMGMEVGVAVNGVSIFNSFDALLRDAAGNEVQDSCDGHPQVSGQYHYHSMSNCFKDKSVKTVLGYALDGFPITGPYVDSKNYLTTNDLDECHGLTSEIILEGKKVTMYHYVMTHDFPYTVSCFRGQPVRQQVIQQAGMFQNMRNNIQNGFQSIFGVQGALDMRQNGGAVLPHVVACENKQEGSPCSFKGMGGENISGICGNDPSGQIGCMK